jgi:Ni/Co efflux regulator RcnB
MLKQKLTCCVIAIAAAGAAVPVFAQDRDHDGRMDRYEHNDRNAYNNRYDRHDHDARVMGNNGWREGHHEWRRGDRLPDQYRHRQYVVNDWRAHHLHAPPRGYQWVNVDGDFVLAAIATGVIADLALNSR